LPVIELRTGSEWRAMMRTHHPIFKVMASTYPDAGSADKDAPPPNNDSPLLNVV
jgi:hypothetical protein